MGAPPVLAAGAFGIGVTEFAPMGLLSLIAGDLGVSIPAAGLLVTAYALGVMIGAPLVTLATIRMPRKALLVALMGVFTLGNLLAALSASYPTLLTARLITSLCHGAFFGVGSLVAADMVAKQDRASAIAVMFMGLTVANIGGVSLAAWVGTVTGWRVAFWGIASLGIFAMALVAIALPAGGAVLIEPVSGRFPRYQGIYQGILRFWAFPRRFPIEKVLCCSGFSRISLREPTGKIVGLTAKSRRVSGNCRRKDPLWTTKSILPNMATMSVGAQRGFHRARHGRTCRQDTNPPSQGNKTDHANPLSGRNDINRTGVLKRDEHEE